MRGLLVATRPGIRRNDALCGDELCVAQDSQGKQKLQLSQNEVVEGRRVEGAVLPSSLGGGGTVRLRLGLPSFLLFMTYLYAGATS